MPTCPSCGRRWTYMETFTRMWAVRKHQSTCPSCHRESKVGIKLRMVFLCSFIPLVLYPFVLSERIQIPAYMIGLTLTALSLISLMPFCTYVRNRP
ncbi:TIGR04104 family putative zinc finger protein [Halobacillus kuroshimensis]|uniref:TIGR04104 family putative zinc finger protein n=1 Tax=Halobacillus kuroshimensis TaxID=302481 RepID=UPI000A02CB33